MGREMGVEGNMLKEFISAFAEARRVAVKRKDGRSYLFGAVGVRRDGTKVVSRNGASRSKGFRCHAEARLCRKLDIGSVIWVVRVSRRDGSFRLARPCVHCEKILRQSGVRRCFYSISETEYGTLEF
jgi:tRNA(Arg) A34 adenosine deaminase TadA